MTRKYVNEAVKEALETQGISCDPQLREAVDLAVDAAYDYVLSFAQDVSQELVGVGLYSEAMVAGVFVRKLKSLMSK